MKLIGNLKKQVEETKNKEEAKEVLKELIGADTAFLFKASRGMALEELCSFCRDLASDLREE